MKKIAIKSVANLRGGGRGLTPPPQGFDPCRPKGSPFELFSDIQFWLKDLKLFLGAPLAPVYSYFKGVRAPKKRNFFVNIFAKIA